MVQNMNTLCLSDKRHVDLGSNGDAGGKANSTKCCSKGMALSNATAPHLPPSVQRFTYNRSKLFPGIVHIGVGNFFRAHLALYVEKCLHLPGQEAWGIVGVGIRGGADSLKKVERIEAQNGLYTLTEYSPDGSVSVRVIGAMIGYLHAPSDPQAVLDRIAAPETRIISLTITEGGYNIDETTKEFDLLNPQVQHDLANPTTPKSVFGLIVQALFLRRAAGLKGLTILSCDNLRGNGEVTEKAVTDFAKARDSELALWIAENMSFPNSMVDRIAPTVGISEQVKANSHSGVADENSVISESFTQWVVEDKFVAGRPCFEQVGVELRNDVAKFEVMKQRLLNGSHSMLAYPALMCGYRLTDEALRQETIVSYLTAFMKKDVIPFVKEICPEGVDLMAYMNSIIARFGNPEAGDQLLRIASNGCSKFPVYLSNTFSNLLSKGATLERAALLAASFEHYLKGSDMKGGTFTPDEPNLTDDDRNILASGDPYAVLKTSAFAALDLAQSEKFRQKFDGARNRMMIEGPEMALKFAGLAD